MRISNILCVTIMAALFATATTAGAIVRNITAQISSDVQAFVGGVAESSDQASEDIGEDGVDPPAETEANLEAFDDADAQTAEGLGISEFRDPSLSGPDRNPGEMSVEADCFSNDADTNYEVTSVAKERRVISLSAAEMQGRTTARSALFASGAIFLWTLDEGRDLTGLSGEVSFVIRRFAVDEDGEPVGDGEVLVEESASLVGGPNDSVTGSNSSGIFVFFGDLAILPDDEELPTGGLPDINIGALAVARVAVILEQDIEYDYDIVFDEDFLLEAEFTTSVSNLPDGTGVVAVFGRPLDEATEIISIGIPEESAKSVVRRINKAMGQPAPGNEPAVGFGPTVCGNFGLELLPFLGLSMAMFFSRRSRVIG